MTTWEEINEGEQNKKDIRKWLIAVVICFGVYLFGVLEIQEKCDKTLSMGWILAYSITEQIWSRAEILIFGSLFLYVKSKFWKKYWYFILLILLVIMGVTIPSSMKKYQINGERPIFAEVLVNEIKDIAENEYEIIKCSKCEIVEKKNIVFIRRRYNKTRYERKDYYDYYLSVNGGKYVLPVFPKYEQEVLKLQEAGIKEIKVYANTKFLVEINGVPINKIK